MMIVRLLIDWLFYRNRRVETGLYDGYGAIHPHAIHPPLMVAARLKQRLELGDRVEYVIVERFDGPAEARRVRVYRRMS